MLRARIEQRSPVLGGVDANAETVVDACEAARGDADVVVFPELFLTGYHVSPSELAALEPDVEAALARVAEATADLVVVVGTPTYDDGDDGDDDTDRDRAGDADAPYNSAVVFDDGDRVGRFDKVHSYGDESGRFAAGDVFDPVETSAGALGVEICYDLEFPEAARTLALRGADVLVTVLANMRPFEAYQRTYARARSMENQLPHLLCNRVGAEERDDFFGESVVVDAVGEVVASAPADGSTALVADLPDSAADDSLSYFADRRPETYD